MGSPPILKGFTTWTLTLLLLHVIFFHTLAFFSEMFHICSSSRGSSCLNFSSFSLIKQRVGKHALSAFTFSLSRNMSLHFFKCHSCYLQARSQLSVLGLKDSGYSSYFPLWNFFCKTPVSSPCSLLNVLLLFLTKQISSKQIVNGDQGVKLL